MSYKKLIDFYSCMNSYSNSCCLQKCHISLHCRFLLCCYLGILFFANPEIVANANIPKRATPSNNPAP